ncbi:hypothetical protein ABW20_dc0108517 [Dactylellina cionopaga]|nr:hypothetical protein ABW20_dc0108517 [Dactylellina cionopaga]
MSSQHSDLHHHHFEYFGGKIDRALHPIETAKAKIAKSYYAKSANGYAIPESETVVVKSVRKTKAPAAAPAAPVAVASSDFTIPCHHIRVGDLVILQKRPSQIIRITTSAATGQHRYLGVDLFSGELREEVCVISHPSPSVVIHSMLTPAFKQYKVIQAGDDATLFVQTDNGEVKTGIKIVAQGDLTKKINTAFGESPGAVRVLVISDGEKELIVDFKKAHDNYKL